MHGLMGLSGARRRAMFILAGLIIFSLTFAPLLPIFSGPPIAKSMSLAQSDMGAEPMPVDGPGVAQRNAGLPITLSDGQEPPPGAGETIPPAPAEPLDDATTQQILDRLPPLATEPEDTREFRLPEETLPPPRPGVTISETFPATTTAPAEPASPTQGPLEVRRYSPEGEIPIAPFLSVTFNQPMVPLATVEDLSARDVPVQITPPLSGTWRWVGTQTLTFEYDGGASTGTEDNQSFPMATVFTATVPAGAQSATGGELAEAVSWTFSTPAPQLTYYAPARSPQPRSPLLFAAFNQRIRPEAVLETIRVTAGGETYPVRLASEEEVTAQSDISAMANRAGEGRWVAFKVEEELPAATTVVVNIGPGTPSAEGPRATETVQSFSFQTYAPLRVERAQCAWGGDECPPLTPIEIAFNNPLDEEAFSEDWVTVEPEIPGLNINNYGYALQLQGATEGQTTYRITLDRDLQDRFGQTLGSDQTVEIRTSAARATLQGTRESLVTVDPAAQAPTLDIYTVNLERVRVRAYAVSPQDWPAYMNFLEQYRNQNAPSPPGQEVMSRIITLESAQDAMVATTLDFSSAMEGETGHIVAIVDRPRNPLFGNNNNIQPVITWLQSTQIGLDAFYDNTDLVAWTSSLSSGAPQAGVEVRFLNSDIEGATDDNGIARLSLPNQRSPLLVAEQGGDQAILPRSRYAWSRDGYQANPVQDEVAWYVFDDRAMYRPGETVHLKGWVRQLERGTGGSIRLLEGVTGVRYQVRGPQGNLLADEIADVNNLGGFNFTLDLPTNVNLGHANVQLNVLGAQGVLGQENYHSFQIQEFRRPEFEVQASNVGQGPYLAGENAEVAVRAAYYAGGPLPNAETTWNVSATPSHYAPPNWPDYTFGQWTPWWGYTGEYGASRGGGGASYTHESSTDAAGMHYLRMDFGAPDMPRPYSVRAEAVVMDVNRQAWAANTSLLVHPADLYVGLRSERTFVDQGEPLEIDAIVTDLDGNPVEDRLITMRAVRLEWEFSGGRWQQSPQDEQVCEVGSTPEPVQCTFETPVGGEYQITATIQDSQGRANSASLMRWVSGGKRPTQRNVEQEEAVLIPDQESYQPGDMAEILVQSPFTPAHGLMTVNREGIVATERFTMTESTYTLQVPIEEAYIPNAHVQVELVGSAPRLDDRGEELPEAPARPAFASGQLNLSIPPLSRTLAVTATLEATEFAPGASTQMEVRVQDAGGAPVQDAELAVVVVDEAILALTNYQLRDPVATFYRTRPAGSSASHGRDTLILADPASIMQSAGDEMARAAIPAEPTMDAAGAAGAESAADGAEMEESAMMAAPQAEAAADDSAAGEQEAITIRTDFNPLAVFEPAVRTDANGRATVDVQLPDNLTRYRVMVVAVADALYYGSAETNLTARLPLMVRPSAPRFLNFGDRFELPMVVQNQTDTDLTVDVAARAGNLNLAESAGQRITIPANDRREVRMAATTQSPGTARIQVAAVSGEYADAATVDLPVYTPATTEAFATYGVIDEGAIAQPVAAPDNVIEQFGGLEVATSSTAVQSLTDAVLYLNSYPYECSEQIASRLMGIAALRDVLTAFEAEELPSPEALNQTVARDIERLQQFQNNDGGFPIWTRGAQSVPYYSIHVTHALARARAKDYAVPEEMMQRALDYLRNVENHYPHWYGRATRHALSAYAVYVRDLLGDVDTQKARALLNEMPLEDQSLEAIAWIWQVLSGDEASGDLVAQIRQHINNRAVETASAANFTTSYGDDAYLMLHSNRRTDAVVLDALINDQPESDLIPKVVNGLQAHRTKGRWSNTQENVFVLLALDRYFNTFEDVTPDFVAQLWLGDTYAGDHEFEGRTTETRETTIPMSYLVEPQQENGAQENGVQENGDGETQDFIINKEGEGRLYYRLGLRYAPSDLDLDPLDQGFTVQRVYEAVDDPDDVQRDEDGAWRIQAGSRVRVRLTMVTENRRYHVALADPLPAGLEIINPALAVAEDIPADPNERQRGWWWWTWYEHQNLRDERAEAFTTLLWEGVYNYSYVARATTPGEYIVPPTKAEEMYTPEVFGRTGTDRVIVE